MRQLGDDLKHDPKDVIVMKSAGQGDLKDAANLAAARLFAYNKFTEMSLKFCSRGLNFSSGSMSETENGRF